MENLGRGPLVSVLMPTYNVETFVKQAIRSILDQSLVDLELLIQDDGSTDNTLAIARELAAADERIVILSPFDSNRGVIAARNSLLARARGEFIAWMDSDDSSEKDRLRTQFRFLESNSHFGAVGTAIRHADEEMRPLRVERFSADPRVQAIDPQICCATVMTRRVAAAKAGPLRDAFGPGGEDGDWLLRLADHSEITNIDDVLYTYRRRDGVSRRGASAIRRLGVLARCAARLRRAGRADPIDAIALDPALNYLADSVFLDNSELSVDEKLTALRQALPGHQPLISVLIPYFNARRFFDQCLRHLASQTFQNFEVLIFDDGSDEALDLEHVESVLGGIPVRLTRGDANQGVATGRNRLLGLSSATFVAWQDADDYSSSDRLEMQLRYLLANPDCNAVGTAINYVRNTVVTRSERYARYAFGRRGFSGCCATFMLRKQAADAVGGFRIQYSNASEDVDFLSRLAPRNSVHNVGAMLYHYRRHDGQLTARADWVHSQAFYFLARHLEEFGIAPLLADELTAEDVSDQLAGLLRLRRARLDGTPLGYMYLRLLLERVKAGDQSLLSLIPIACRFPLAMTRLMLVFVGHRGFRRWKRPQCAGPVVGTVGPLGAEALGLLTRHLEAYGLAHSDDLPHSDVAILGRFDRFLRLRRATIDGTPAGEMYVRMVLQEIKSGAKSLLALAPCSLRFPRTMAKAAAAFVRHRSALLLRGRKSVGAPAMAAASAGASGVVQATAAAAQARTAASPILRLRPAPNVARCIDCWGDLDDAISQLTPGGSGIWGKVAFVRKTSYLPDWHVIFNSPEGSPIDIEASPNRVLFAIGEPPTGIHRVMHEGQCADTIVLTSDEELCRLEAPQRRYVLSPAITRSWLVRKTYDYLRTSRVEDKPHRLSWVTSNLAIMRGHRYRLAFLERLRRELDFDLFGRGFRPIRDKWDGIAPYRYSIAFENSRASYYFTEKLMDCFVAETMPIYYGSPDIESFFPADSMVRIDPEDPDVVAKIEEVIVSDLWSKKREAIREAKHLVLEKYNTFARLAEFIENTVESPAPCGAMRINPVVIDFGAEA